MEHTPHNKGTKEPRLVKLIDHFPHNKGSKGAAVSHNSPHHKGTKGAAVSHAESNWHKIDPSATLAEVRSLATVATHPSAKSVGSHGLIARVSLMH